MVNWRDNLCAPDTLGMALAIIGRKIDLETCGPLGTAWVHLQQELGKQSREGIDQVQSTVEALLPKVLGRQANYKKGGYCDVGDLWEALCVPASSAASLCAVGIAQCSCMVVPSTTLSTACLTVPRAGVPGWATSSYFRVTLTEPSGLRCGEVDLGNISSCLDFSLTTSYTTNRAVYRTCMCGAELHYSVHVEMPKLLSIRIEPESKYPPLLSNLCILNEEYLLRAVIMFTGSHYSAYIQAEDVEWLKCGWYYYDGIDNVKLRSIGTVLKVDKKHIEEVRMLLYTKV